MPRPTAAAWPAGSRPKGAPYYLVRYRSSNTKLDGRFRALSARTTRPDVRLRVRRGYRGATPDELLSDRAARRARDRAASAAEPPPSRAAVVQDPDRGVGQHRRRSFWVVGELDPRLRRELVWTATVKAEVTVMAGDGRQVLTRTLDVPPAENSFALRVPDQGRFPTRTTPYAFASTRRATPASH